MGMFSVIKPVTYDCTNLVTNPSFELGTLNWSSDHSILSSFNYQFRGQKSLKIKYYGSAYGTLLASTPITLPHTGKHIASVYVYLTDSWTATVGSKLTFESYTGATIVNGTVDPTIKNRWQRVVCTIQALVGDLVGTLSLKADVAGSYPAPDGECYIDCVQVEYYSEATTYFDGDQKECYWMDQPHNSKSIRIANSREGGEEIDFDDLGFMIKSAIGVGMPTITNIVQENALMPGSIDNGHKVQTRKFMLVGDLVGSSHANLQANRKALIEAIKPELSYESESIWIYYRGVGLSGPPIRLRAKYDQGLSIGEQVGFTEPLALQFISNDPYWQEEREVLSQLLNPIAFDDHTNCIFTLDKFGNSNNLGYGFEEYVWDMKFHPITKELYVCGNFLINQTNKLFLLKWSNGSWQSVISAGDFNAGVYALEFDAAGTLYVGGNFTTINGVSYSRIAKINTTTGAVSAVGTGALDGSVFELTYDGLYIYAGGSFTQMGGVANTSRIARIPASGGSWAAMGTGANNYVNVILVDKNGKIFVGGFFTLMGGVSGTSKIAYWDTAWRAMGTGITGGTDPEVMALAVDSKNNIYIGGVWTTAGGLSIAGIVMWDQTGYKKLGTGVISTYVKTIAIDSNDLVYISGLSTYYGDLYAYTRSAIWNGSTFVHFPFMPPQYFEECERIFIDSKDTLHMSFTTKSSSGIYGAYHPGINTVINPGTAKVFPKLIISGYTNVLYIKNITTGAVLWLNKQLNESEIITIDFDPYNKKVISNRFGDITGKMFLRNSQFSDFYLMPGTNKIAVFSSEGTPTFNMIIPIKHISIDGGA